MGQIIITLIGFTLGWVLKGILRPSTELIIYVTESEVTCGTCEGVRDGTLRIDNTEQD